MYNTHGGTTVVGGGAPATTVVKPSNQQDVKNHNIEMKLKQSFSRSEVDRSALATVRRTRRRRCRPRGRRARTAVSRRSQATKAGRLDAQGVGEAIERFAATVETLQRQCELVEDEQGRWEKQRTRKEERRRLQSFIGRPRKQGEATAESFPRQHEAKAATRAPGTTKFKFTELQNCHPV